VIDAEAQPGNVIEELRGKYDQLTQSQKRIAEAIVEDPQFVAFATVDKLANRLGVSPSTIVRFAYRLGIDGYNDLQERVRNIVRSQLPGNASPAVHRRATRNLGPGSVFTESLEHDLSILRRTVEGLSPEALSRAVEALAASRRVFVAAAASSHAIAYYSAYALNRIRGDALLLDGADDQIATQLLSLVADDALLLFTFPPYASSSLRAARLARERGATTIAVTDTPISPAGQIVDIVLPTLCSGISAQNSHVPAMAVANALLNGLSVVNPGDVLARYGRLTRLMNDWDVFVLKGDATSDGEQGA
jgi:DNA-binding MurR/RpiR family transcriptional regulator